MAFQRPILLLTLLAFAIGVACGGRPDDAANGVEVVPLSATPAGQPGAGTPATTPAISLTPRPASTPADPARARRLEAEGEVSAAIDAYLSLASAAGPARAEGVTGAARLLLKADHAEEARILLEPFVAGEGDQAGASPYLLARAYAALGRRDDALKQYGLYIQSGRAALPYAYLERARLLFDSGEAAAAAVEAQRGLPYSMPAPARRSFIALIAQSYERAGALSDARTWYQSLINASDLAGDQALALSRIAALKRIVGDTTYAADYQALLGGYPSTSQALAALNDLLARGEAVDSYLEGFVFYRHNDYSKAEPAFAEKVAQAPDAPSSAEAYYYLAAIYESRGDPDKAKATYAKAFALNPASSLADDALWWRGRLLEDEGDLATAGSLYAQLGRDYPASPWAADASFRHGLLLYRAARYRDAATAWVAARSLTSDPTQRDRLAFWQGKALLSAGDREGGQAILGQLATDGEDDYYGIRAVSVLQGENGQPRATRESKVDLSPSYDWATAEAWLTQRTGRSLDSAAGRAWTGDVRWLRAQELWLVGRDSEADAEAFDLIEAYAGDPIAMYTLAQALRSQGRLGLSGRAGQRLLRVLNTNPNAGLPQALLSLSYPPAFAASVERYAQAEKISPLLVLAFVRQESFFDPDALSGAGAIGLTQVLPETGRSVARRLGIADYDAKRLTEADLNLRLGASYMAEQLRTFANRIFVALAAYNAGESAAGRWLKSAGDDPDLYLETVEFRETRLYVQLVAENYAIYRYLYGGETAPTLPGD